MLPGSEKKNKTKKIQTLPKKHKKSIHENIV